MLAISLRASPIRVTSPLVRVKSLKGSGWLDQGNAKMMFLIIQTTIIIMEIGTQYKDITLTAYRESNVLSEFGSGCSKSD